MDREYNVIQNTPLASKRADMPAIPTPDKIAGYTRKQRFASKRREQWESSVLAEVPSVTVPDHSVLAVNPEYFWPKANKRAEKSVRKDQRKAQEEARVSAFAQVRQADINRAIGAEVEKYSNQAAANKQEFDGQKTPEARAYALAMTINNLAERPTQHAKEQLQALLNNMPAPMKIVFNWAGKIIPGNDIFEQISDVLSNDSSKANNALSTIGQTAKGIRDGLVADHGVDYGLARLQQHNPTAHRRHHNRSSALEHIASFGAAAAMAKLLPPSEGKVGLVAETAVGGEIIEGLIKRFSGRAGEIAAAAARVATDMASARFGHAKNGAKSSAHLAELLISVALGKDMQGMSEKVSDFLFAAYAAEHPQEFANTVRASVTEHMYHDANKADLAIVNRVIETKFMKRRAAKAAKSLSDKGNAEMSSWAK